VLSWRVRIDPVFFHSLYSLSISSLFLQVALRCFLRVAALATFSLLSMIARDVKRNWFSCWGCVKIFGRCQGELIFLMMFCYDFRMEIWTGYELDFWFWHPIKLFNSPIEQSTSSFVIYVLQYVY
jgi:hypothetical protein